MTRTYLKLVDGNWKELEGEETSDFWLDTFLYRKLVSLKLIQEKGWDGVIVVDGKERSGKSVLGMIIGWYLSNGKLTLNNFARGLNDAAEKIAQLEDGSVIVVDEASTVFASKDSMTEEGKQLIKIMDIVGQKNLLFILCLPCFFDLNKTMAVRRSLFLCHTYPDEKYNRGRYAFWGELGKKTLYIEGKKRYDSYAFPEPDFIGEYFDFAPPFYKEYVEIVKRESLRDVLKTAIEHNQWKDSHKAVFNREAMIAYKLKNIYNININVLKDIFALSADAIYERINHYKAINLIKEGDVVKKTTI